MRKPSRLIKVLAIVSTVLIWIPIAATLITGIPRSIEIRQIQFDYLMPAELGFFYLIGSILLIILSYRQRMIFKPILLVFVLSILAVVGGQVVAVVTGLASGAVGPSGWPFIVTIGLIILYAVFNIIEGILSIRFSQRLSKIDHQPVDPA